jgi:hypothetical protein
VEEKDKLERQTERKCTEDEKGTKNVLLDPTWKDREGFRTVYVEMHPDGSVYGHDSPQSGCWYGLNLNKTRNIKYNINIFIFTWLLNSI